MANKKTQDDAVRPGEFSSAITQICDEKGISQESVISTIEAALAAAYKKDYGKKSQNIRAEFNVVSGQTKFFLVKEVVDEATREFVSEDADDAENAEKAEGDSKKEDKFKKKESETEAEDEEEKLLRYNPERDIILDEAKKIKKGAKVGDIIETELEPKDDYGRVAAQTAKQVIIQRIREAERDSMFKEYKEKEGEIVSGTVQRMEGNNAFVDIGKSTGVLFPSEQVEGENYRIGQRVKVYIMKVETDTRGPGIILSRAHSEMVRKLFELEVPEIFAGTVEIKAIAREAGARTKIAVTSKEEGIDPIGSCVGQKGSRVQAVIDELGGEKIDIIEWNEDVEKFISASLNPAKVISIETNKEEKAATVTVPEDQLSLAIGKRGQNVRLAAKLTEWKIDVVGGGRVEQDEESATGESDSGEKEKEEKNEEKPEIESEISKVESEEKEEGKK